MHTEQHARWQGQHNVHSLGAAPPSPSQFHPPYTGFHPTPTSPSQGNTRTESEKERRLRTTRLRELLRTREEVTDHHRLDLADPHHTQKGHLTHHHAIPWCLARSLEVLERYGRRAACISRKDMPMGVNFKRCGERMAGFGLRRLVHGRSAELQRAASLCQVRRL